MVLEISRKEGADSGKIRIIFGFSLGILVLFFAGVYGYRVIQKYKKASDWVSHTHKVIAEAKNLLAAIQEVETSQRGYVISGDTAYINNCNKGIEDTKLTYNRLKYLIRDNSTQQLLLRSIDTILHAKIDFANKVVMASKTGGFTMGKKLVMTGRGKRLMNALRSKLSLFIAREQSLLSARTLIAYQENASAQNNIISSFVLALLILGLAFYFLIRDYNRRLRSELQLIQSDERTKQFMESLPVGVYILGADGRPYYANGKSKEILGKGIMPDVSTQELPDVYNAYVTGTNEIYPFERQPIVKALNGEVVLFSEDMEIEKQGVRIPLRINATPIKDLYGKIEYAIAVFEDITGTRDVERKLLEAKRLAEESAILKETFLANMSHEIRTPMNAIIGFTELLLRYDLDQQKEDYVRTIKTSAESLLRIINDVLDVSKMEAGLMTFESHPISIKEIFNSLNSMLLQKASDKNIQLSFKYDQNLPVVVMGDPTRLTQILLNLIGNALKFTNNGEVNVFAKLRRENEHGYEVEFSVKDSGIGISPDKLKHIFDRFTQAESSTTRHYGGTGLGLNIAKQLIELQNGEIQVESTEGVGSLFTFVLPFEKAKESLPLGEKKNFVFNTNLLKPKRILVVEDNPVNIKFIFSLFDYYNLKGDFAENGKIAVDMVRDKDYDIILMDIDMPEMNGYEATRIIRTDLKISTPIIAMTAHAFAGEKEKCLQMGMNDYLSKPIAAELLFEKMYELSISSHEKQGSINLDMLTEFMVGEKEAIRETINVFLKQFPEDLAVLKESIEKGDLVTVASYSHRMISSAALMGMKLVETLLTELEVLAKQNVSPDSLIVTYKALSVEAESGIKELVDAGTRLG